MRSVDSQLFKQHRGVLERLGSYMLLGLTIGIMLGVVWPTLNNTGYLTGWDAGGHLLKAYYWAHNLLPRGYLSGWFPVWHGGFDIFQFYPPLLYFLLGPLTMVLTPEFSLRLITAGLWIGLVPVTYYFLRSFKMTRPLAAFGTTFLLSLNASFGLGLGALYGVGLLPNGLGFIMAIWALGRLERELADPDRSNRQLVITGLVVGALILSHTFSTYWWALSSVILLACHAIGRPDAWRLVKRYLTILSIGLAVSAFWWVPLLLTRSSMGVTGAIQQDTRSHIFTGLLFAKDSGGWIFSLLALGGLVYLGLVRRFRLLAFFLAAGTVSLLLSLNLGNDILPFGSVVGSSQFIRFHAFFVWLLMMMAVFGVVGIWSALTRIKTPGIPYILWGAGAGILIMVTILPTLDVKRGFVVTLNNASTQELTSVADYLDKNLQPGDFILSEYNWELRYTAGSPHFPNQHLPLMSNKVRDLNGNFPEGTHGSEEPVLIAQQFGQPDYLATKLPYLQSRGVRYLVTSVPESASELLFEPALKPVWQGSQYSIFELTGERRPYGLPIDAARQLTDVRETPNQTELVFKQPVTLPAGTTLATSYHPWLHVKNGTTEIPVTDSDALLQLKSPVATNDLTIEYRPPLISKVAGFFSILSVMVALAYIVSWHKKPVSVRKLRPSKATGRRKARKG